VGLLKSGSMKNNNNGGYPGYTIAQIAGKTDANLAMKPNVVCLMAGTNDHLWGSTAGADPKTASTRITALVDQIVKGAPSAVLLLATLPPQTFSGKYSKYSKSSYPVEAFNKQIPGIAKAAADKGGKVLAVDMGALTASDLDDGVHPNDAGFAKMSTAFFAGIESAASKGWIKNPVH
jgi:lysophospholipase L1-like esterase